MTPQVLKRFVILMGVLVALTAVFWPVIDDFRRQEPGDYHSSRGDQLLSAGDYEQALEHFEQALEEKEDHLGAHMGRGLVYVQTGNYPEALAEFDFVIGELEGLDEPLSDVQRLALAVAHANKGNVLDRQAHYEEAFESYVQSLRVDAEAVEGPDLIDKLLYAQGKVSTVRDRARYIHEQLQLPEEERLLSVPELDATQRMHKP